MRIIRLFSFVSFFFISFHLHSQGFAEFVVSFDHLTATYNRITPSLGFMYVGLGAGYDHQGNRLWFNSNTTGAVGADWDLYCIDTQTGNTLNHFLSYTTGPAYISAMVYDNSTDTLYGILNNGTLPTEAYFVWVDQTTGAIHTKRHLPYINSVIESELTLDEENHRLIFLGFQDTSVVSYRLYTLNVNTGDLIYQPHLPPAMNRVNFTYNHADDQLYAIVDSATWTDSKLQTFDLVTGERTSVAILPKRYIISRNTCALDEASGHFIYVSQAPNPDSIYTVDINTQTIIHRVAYPYDPSGASDTIENLLNYFYDPSEQTIFAIHYGRLLGKPAGINEVDNRFKVYPNPSSGKFTISSLDKIDILEIFNQTGQQVRKYQPLNLQVDVDLSLLPPGTYWIRMLSKNIISTKRIVIQ